MSGKEGSSYAGWIGILLALEQITSRQLQSVLGGKGGRKGVTASTTSISMCKATEANTNRKT